MPVKCQLHDINMDIIIKNGKTVYRCAKCAALKEAQEKTTKILK